MFGKRIKKSLGQCKADQGHPLATPQCHNSSHMQWNSRQRVDENLLQLLFPRHPHPPLLLQVARGLTLNEDSQSRLLACHTATHHTSSSHERLIAFRLLRCCRLRLLNAIARAVCAALEFATEAPKRPRACFSSSRMPHMLQVAVKGPQFERHLPKRRMNVTTCRSNGADGQKRPSATIRLLGARRSMPTQRTDQIKGVRAQNNEHRLQTPESDKTGEIHLEHQ